LTCRAGIRSKAAGKRSRGNSAASLRSSCVAVGVAEEKQGWGGADLQGGVRALRSGAGWRGPCWSEGDRRRRDQLFSRSVERARGVQCTAAARRQSSRRAVVEDVQVGARLTAHWQRRSGLAAPQVGVAWRAHTCRRRRRGMQSLQTYGWRVMKVSAADLALAATGGEEVSSAAGTWETAVTRYPCVELFGRR
jgi:hypothetical protein